MIILNLQIIILSRNLCSYLNFHLSIMSILLIARKSIFTLAYRLYANSLFMGFYKSFKDFGN